MNNVLTENDICKEVYTMLAYFDTDLLNKIPDNVLRKIVELASESEKDVFVDAEKNLQDQNISEESKDLLSIIYYNYIANEDEKREILKIWSTNEKNIQNELKEKFNIDNIFDKNEEKIESIKNDESLVKHKESIFRKIFNKIKNLLDK